jgi:SAM-dependent methyltransferase
MDTTKDYYEKNAEAFIQSSLTIEMKPIYEKFIPLLTVGGKILDAGCGSGRDSLFFKKQGFSVTAIDNNEKFVAFTREYAGVEAYCLAFNELIYNNEFDGIWACASLLHLNKDDLAETLKRFAKALKPGGISYMSFKYGDFSGDRNGRTFTDLNQDNFTVMLKNIPALKIIETWITGDQRQERAEEKWFNVLART